MRKLWTVARLCALAGVLAFTSAHRLAAQDFPIPFVVTVPVNVNNFVYTQVAIPQGNRLVIDFIALSGAAQATNGPIQPIVILNASVGGASSNLFYFGPTPSATVPGQYYMSEKTVIYADSLSVSPAFAGYTPSFLAFNVVISGHLISLSTTPGAPVGKSGGEPVPAPGIIGPPVKR